MPTTKTKTKKASNGKMAEKKTSTCAKSAVKTRSAAKKWEKATLVLREHGLATAKRIAKGALWLGGGLLAAIILFFIYINLPVARSEKAVPLGVTFSSRYATDIGLDWRENYLAMLDELKLKKIRIPIYWDLIEKEKGRYDFTEIDWQLTEAAKRNAKITLVVGQKVPRWPECFIPEWAKNDDEERKAEQIAFVEKVVDRYKHNAVVERWQVENEPFLDFGICPVMDPALLDKEIATVRSLDPSRPLVVTDSGELSLWVKAASRADIFGTTMYREVYSAKMGHWRYPIGPNFFKAKRFLVSLFAKQDNVIVIELQGEPWVQGWTVHAPLATQLASMNAEILKDNFEFAKKTGVSEIYIWGVEWWYWMKKEHNDNSLWEAAEKLNLEQTNFL